MKSPSFGVSRRAAILAGVLVALVLVWGVYDWQFKEPLAVELLLHSTSPREEPFSALANQAADPVAFLQRFWATGKIPHRQLVAAFLNAHATANPPWFNRAEPLVLAGATDADESVRELALAILATRHSPRLLECAEAQLKDVDPMLRLLGLEYLRQADPQRAVPLLIPLLDDPDLRVVAEAEVTLRRFTGIDYGVRARQAVPVSEGPLAGSVDPANTELIHRGVECRKQWWQSHARDYPARPVEVPGSVLTGEPRPLPAADFQLSDLGGRNARLSQWRGKAVLLNFWATWCPACLTEIPELVALQNKLGNRVRIVGVALDGVPDEDGEQDAAEPGKQRPSLKTIHAKVARAVKARGINYPVLLDPHGQAGSRFNGGELPTTILIDAEGRVRRRFIGGRSVGVFEAMLAQVQTHGN